MTTIRDLADMLPTAHADPGFEDGVKTLVDAVEGAEYALVPRALVLKLAAEHIALDAALRADGMAPSRATHLALQTFRSESWPAARELGALAEELAP